MNLCDGFSKSAWLYINTYIFGAKYIANRCGLTVSELKDKVNNCTESIQLEKALFYAGARVDVTTISNELFVSPSDALCRGSYRHISKRLSMNSLITLCEDLTGGGDICEGDIYRIIEVCDKKLILIHHSCNTHVIEIDKNWLHYLKLESILEKYTCNLQVEDEISPANIASIKYFIQSLNSLTSANDYYRLIDYFNDCASGFVTGTFIKR